LLFLAVLNFTTWHAPRFGALGLVATAAWFWALGWPIHWVMLWRWGSRPTRMVCRNRRRCVATEAYVGDDLKMERDARTDRSEGVSSLPDDSSYSPKAFSESKLRPSQHARAALLRPENTRIGSMMILHRMPFATP
jgi:hypothetical protein